MKLIRIQALIFQIVEMNYCFLINVLIIIKK
jgi:hypothetical protein